MHRVLFICSGNFYRSRFAEALFNHRAPSGWSAFSRGLRVVHQGDLSPRTIKALGAREIPLSKTAPYPLPLTRLCLARSERCIALSLREHRPMVERQFPDWLDRIAFWEIEDVDLWTEERTFAGIERRLEALFAQLGSQGEG